MEQKSYQNQSEKPQKWSHPAIELAKTSGLSQSQREYWQIQKSALSRKFGPSGWSPRKRLSPDSLDGIRSLHAQNPERHSTPALAEYFKVSPEAIRRILKSKWTPNDEEEDQRRGRWIRRGINIWGQMSELGVKPPRKWRDQGVGKCGDYPLARKERFKTSSRKDSEIVMESFSDQHAIDPKRIPPTFLAERIL